MHTKSVIRSDTIHGKMDLDTRGREASFQSLEIQWHFRRVGTTFCFLYSFCLLLFSDLYLFSSVIGLKWAIGTF